jgi:hypothetical protein
MVDPESVARSFDAALAPLDKRMKWIKAQRSLYCIGEITGVGALVETVPGPIAHDFGNFADTSWTSSPKATGRQRSSSTRGVRA